MAKHVLFNAFVSINAVDVSDHVESIEFTESIGSQPAGGMGEIHNYGMPAAKEVSAITLTMFQDYAVGETYATLQPLWEARSIFNVVIRPDSGAASPTNPQWTVPCFVSSFPLLSGTRAERNMAQVELMPAGVMTIATA